MSFKRLLGIIFLTVAIYTVYSIVDAWSTFDALTKFFGKKSLNSILYDARIEDKYKLYIGLGGLIFLINFSFFAVFGVKYLIAPKISNFGFVEREVKILLFVIASIWSVNASVGWLIYYDNLELFTSAENAVGNIKIFGFGKSSEFQLINSLSTFKSNIIINTLICFLIALASVLYNQKYISDIFNNNKKLKEIKKFTNTNIFKKNEEFEGERVLENDAYKLFLIKEYSIAKNEILEKYTCGNKIFNSLEEVMLYAKRKDLNSHDVKNKIDRNSLNNEGEKDEKNTAQQVSKSANLLKSDEDVKVNIEIKSFDNEYHKINEELEKQNDHEQFNSLHDFSEKNRPYTNEAKNSEVFLNEGQYNRMLYGEQSKDKIGIFSIGIIICLVLISVAAAYFVYENYSRGTTNERLYKNANDVVEDKNKWYNNETKITVIKFNDNLETVSKRLFLTNLYSIGFKMHDQDHSIVESGSLWIKGQWGEKNNPIFEVTQDCNIKRKLDGGVVFGQLDCNENTVSKLRDLSKKNKNITTICEPLRVDEDQKIMGYADWNKKIFWIINGDKVRTLGIYKNDGIGYGEFGLEKCIPKKRR